MKKKRALKIIADSNSPIYKISFSGGKLRKYIRPNRRSGKPRMSWTEETIREIWNEIKIGNTKYKYAQFKPEDEDMHNLIIEHAKKETRKKKVAQEGE